MLFHTYYLLPWQWEATASLTVKCDPLGAGGLTVCCAWPMHWTLSFVSLLRARQQQTQERSLYVLYFAGVFHRAVFCIVYHMFIWIYAQITMFLLRGARVLQVKDGLESFVRFRGRMSEIRNINPLWKYQCCKKADLGTRSVLVWFKFKSCVRLHIKLWHPKSIL